MDKSYKWLEGLKLDMAKPSQTHPKLVHVSSNRPMDLKDRACFNMATNYGTYLLVKLRQVRKVSHSVSVCVGPFSMCPKHWICCIRKLIIFHA